MNSSRSGARRLFVVLFVVLAMVSAAMSATITVPVANAVDQGQSSYDANGTYSNNNSSAGLIYLGTQLTGEATCNADGMTWSGQGKIGVSSF